MDINPDKIKLAKMAADRHFYAFCYFMNPEFFETRKILKQCCLAVDKLQKGEVNRVSISLSPRAGKSYIATLAAAYFIGKKPIESVMRNSCTATLYNKFSYDVRDIVKGDKFKEIFPEVELSADKTSVTGWNVKQAKQVTYFGNGTGGTIIGFGASMLAITDDLYKSHEEALSEVTNEKTHRWFESAHMSRLEKGCKELDIGTRWHKGDVIGRRMERGDYDISISIPAMIDNKSFCEDVKSTDEYLFIRSITDTFIWESEYMQNPIDSIGLVFPSDSLKYFSERNGNKGFRVAYIDTADAGADYFSMPIVDYYHEQRAGYLIDVLFNLDELLFNEDRVIEKINEHKLDYLIVETNKEGNLFVNNLRRKTDCQVYGVFNTANKVTRILNQAGWIKQLIQFDKNKFDTKSSSSEYYKFMLQLTTFLRTGKAKNDDAPDSLAGLMAFIRRHFGF